VSIPRTLIAFVATGLLLSLTAALGPPVSASTPAVHREPGRRVVNVDLRAAVSSLPVAKETPNGYAREKYRLWIDADGDCQDTRDEVLAAESRTPVSGCDITHGTWFSYYDRVTWTNSADVDIDHLVPLKETWDSGASRWTAETRARYANDLGDSRTLVAVTDNVNQSKSDRDPAEWLPTYDKCRYVREWTAVKLRWGLRVDAAEKAALVAVARGCTDVGLAVTKAKVNTVKPTSGGGTGTGGADHHGGGTGSGHGALDHRFAYCYEVTAAGLGPYYQGRDPEYAWYTDGDSDGIVCE
jgi:hypothetical protein